MVRSAEATRRRAEKRNRTEQDQRKADNREVEKSLEREERERKKVRRENEEKTTTTVTATPEVNDDKKNRENNRNIGVDPALNERGAWICKRCNNHNYASKRVCHSKTCDEKRPASSYVPPKYQQTFRQFQRPAATPGHNDLATTRLPDGIISKSKPRHDPATSKTKKWKEQADTVTLEKNQHLRKIYIETGGKGMEEADVARAKLLLERDERKKQKKALTKKGKGKG